MLYVLSWDVVFVWMLVSFGVCGLFANCLGEFCLV